MDPIILESFDGVPDELKPLVEALAKEKDGKFEIVIPTDRSKDVATLTSTKEKLRREKEALATALEGYKSLLLVDDEELPLDAARELLELGRKAKSGTGNGNGNGDGNGNGKDVIPLSELPNRLKAAQQEWEKGRARKEAETQAELDRLRADLKRNVIVGGVRALANADLPFEWETGAIETLVDLAESDKLLRVHNGSAVVWDNDLDQPAVDAKGEIVGIVGWALKKVQDRQHLVKKSTGTQATQSNSNAKPTPKGLKRSEMSLQAKKDFIAQHGQPKYNSLPW